LGLVIVCRRLLQLLLLLLLVVLVLVLPLFCDLTVNFPSFLTCCRADSPAGLVAKSYRSSVLLDPSLISTAVPSVMCSWTSNHCCM
jgi:hypothetical protein